MKPVATLLKQFAHLRLDVTPKISPETRTKKIIQHCKSDSKTQFEALSAIQYLFTDNELADVLGNFIDQSEIDREIEDYFKNADREIEQGWERTNSVFAESENGK